MHAEASCPQKLVLKVSDTGLDFTSGLNSLAVGFSGSLTKYSPVFEILLLLS